MAETNNGNGTNTMLFKIAVIENNKKSLRGILKNRDRQIKELEEQIDALREQNRTTEGYISKSEAQIAKIIDEVMPKLDKDKVTEIEQELKLRKEE